MFVEIESAQFRFFRHAQSERFFHRVKNSQRARERGEAREDAEQLHAERVFGNGRENSDRERSPDSADEMHGNRADGIVHLDFVHEQHGKHDDHAADQPDQNRRAPRHAVRSRRDADESGEATVERHRQIRLFQNDAARERGADDSRRSAEHRRHQHERDFLRIGVEDAPAVESEPAEPEQENADRRERKIVSHDRAGDAVDEFSDARTDENRSRESRPAADAMHERRSREVVEIQIREPASAPAPRTDDRINEGDENQREQQIRIELRSSRHRAGNDGRARRGEHSLKEKVRPERERSVIRERIAFRRFQPETGESEEMPELPAALARIHQRETAHGVSQKADRRHHRVFEQNVRAVFRAGKPGFHRRETQVHHENEHPAEQHPQVVHEEIQRGRRLGNGRTRSRRSRGLLSSRDGSRQDRERR